MVYVKRKTRHTVQASIPKIKTKVRIPLANGECHFYSFEGLCSYKEHIALSFKQAILEEKPTVAMHYGCFRNETLERCGCGDKLWQSIAYFSHNSGILLYLGIDGCDKDDWNVPYHYKAAAQMLTLMEVKAIRLLSSHTEQICQLQEQGIEVVAV